MTTEQRNQMDSLNQKYYKRRGLYHEEWQELIELRKLFILSQGFDPINFNCGGGSITYKLSGQEYMDMIVKHITPQRFIGFKFK
jgi:hypothetical protein